MARKKKTVWAITYDAMKLRSVINVGERVSFGEAMTRAFGVCNAITKARATRAAMVLYTRQSLGVVREGRDITEVRCLDGQTLYNYMQLEACIYLMIHASLRPATLTEDAPC